MRIEDLAEREPVEEIFLSGLGEIEDNGATVRLTFFVYERGAKVARIALVTPRAAFADMVEACANWDPGGG